jgi:hypothetical protein
MPDPCIELKKNIVKKEKRKNKENRISIKGITNS